MKWMMRTAGMLMVAAMLVAPLAAARPAPPDVKPDVQAPPVPLLWKVSGMQGSALYLLGSFHLLKPSDYPVSKDVDQAFSRARRVVFELSSEEMNSPALAAEMLQAAVRTDGRLLKDDLDADTWQLLQDWANDNSMPLDRLSGLKPWFVGLTVSIAQMTRQGLDPQSGLDRHLMERARKAGKPATGLESAAAQIRMLDGMGAEEQRQLLREALELSGKGDEQSRRLHDAWRRGDADLLWHDMAVEMKRKYPDLYQRINVDRNDAWLPLLQPWLQAGQGDTLVVVGALHLLGEDGVVEKLRAKGYTVERVCSACASP